jgi:hypothetical protein
MDTQIGLLGKKYSLALDDDGSAFNSYNLMLTNLLLYLTNVISHDFFIHFDTSISPSARLKMSREKSVSREISPLTNLLFGAHHRNTNQGQPALIQVSYDISKIVAE